MRTTNQHLDVEKLNKRPITLFFLKLFYGKKMSTAQGTRSAIGKFCGLLGIIFNAILSTGKIVVGVFIHSLATIADGLNNMADAGSSILTLLGFKLAEKPADKDHPYGHARFEYLASLLISVIIFFIGFELIKSSIEKIITPDVVLNSYWVFIVMGASVLIKIFIALYSYSMSKIIKSDTLKGIAIDSRNDVVTSLVVIASLLIQRFTAISIDGYTGCAVALFIIYSAFCLAKETISPLLGEGANKELTEQIEKYVLSFDKVLGCHDLLVHDYGPGNRFASLHVEMDKDEDALHCHEILDEIERVCLKEMGINLVIHFDPVVTNDPVANELKIKAENVLSSFDNSVSLHDFRVRVCDEYLRITFDATIPQNLTAKQCEILEVLQKSIKTIDEKPVLFDVTFDVATYN